MDGRTHTTNTPHKGSSGQHWMSARAMSAHFFTSLNPCLSQSGTYDGVESRGWSDTHSHCSAQFTTLITPNISIERPDAHLADGPTQDVAMANHRPYVRGFTHVFHYVRCFIFSNSKNSKCTRTTGTRCLPTPWDRPAHRSRKSMTRLWWRWPTSQGHMGAGGGPARAGGWRFGEVGS